jgi:predicted lipopolysaccharide heptosyltransferase III
MIQIKKILVINLAFIGDVLLATPVFRGLRTAYPQATIDMLVVPLTEPIAVGNPYVDRVFVYDKRGRHKHYGALYALIRQLRREHYDLSISMNFAVRGVLLAWVSGIKRRVGYDRQHAAWFLTDIANSSRGAHQHETENHLAVLKPLGIDRPDTSLAFCVQPADRESLARKVSFNGRPAIAICPFGSYAKKSWSRPKYAQLLKIMADSYQCFLIGSGAERSGLEAIAVASGTAVRVLGGELTLGELAAFLQQLQLLITVDTGPMHLANAVRTPVVALFGPTDPRIWGPRGANDQVVRAAAQCSPCWGKGECPEQRCMDQIEIADVEAAVQKVAGSILAKKDD